MIEGRKRSKKQWQSRKESKQSLSGCAMAAVRFFFFFLFLLLPLSQSQSHADALLKLKQSLSPANVFDTWLPGSSPCRSAWAGVICDPSGTIIGLHLSNLGLSGPIDALALLPISSLRSIDFTNNDFSGPIPDFNKLSALRSLYLTHNRFSGDIPADYFVPMDSLRQLWLGGNNFTGTIPESLMELPLLQLHLEFNQFSGQIPPAKQPQGLSSLDLSNNNLQGPIPDVFARFDASSFVGNKGLCGLPLDVECSGGGAAQESSSSPQGDPDGSGTDGKIAVAGLLLVVLVFVLCTSIGSAKKKVQPRDDEFSLRMESLNGDVKGAAVAESNRKSSAKGSTRRSTVGGSKKGSQRGGKGAAADLVMVNEEKGSFTMQALMKAAAEVLGNGGLGSAYKATMTSEVVVVKRMKEMNKLGKEAFDAEMRRFGRLKHRNILAPLSYHFRQEEKLIVSAYMPNGSLLYALHGDRGAIHSELNWPTRLKIIQGIARGLSFLHQQFPTYEVPHGNLKSSNVLLTQTYEPMLVDYCFQALVSPSHAPQALFSYKSPQYLQNEQLSPKSDVYCLGILILEILTGKFPPQYLSNSKGGIDVVHWVRTSIADKNEAELIDPEIANDSLALDQMVQLLRIGATCTASNPYERPTLGEVLKRIERIKRSGDQGGQER